MAAVEEHTLTERGALIADLLCRHIRLQVKGVRTECAAGVGKASRADLECTAIFACVCGRSEVRETVLLQNGCVCGICCPRVVAGLSRSLHLPPRKLRGKDGWSGRNGPVSGGSNSDHENNHDKKANLTYKAHGSASGAHNPARQID